MQATAVQPTAAWMNRVAALLHSGETGPHAVARYLPSREDPEFAAALSGLVRADLRRSEGAERSSQWAAYRSHYPELPEQEPEEDFSKVLSTLASERIDLAKTPLPGSIARTNATRIMPVDVIDLSAVPKAVPKCGEEFGGFTLVDELGRGAFGRVYLAAEHNLADRLVALKVTRKPSGESQRLARLQHTNIVPIHNAFALNGWHVVQMPFFGRQTLADLVETVRAEKTFPKVRSDVFASTQMRISTSRKTTQVSQSGSVPPDSNTHRIPREISAEGERQPSRELLVGLGYIDAAIWIMARLADGLAHAHAKGILHLDLKPHNVLISDDGQPMLLDFNLSFDVSKCERDRVGGTWPYMSPEQICEYARRPGAPVDPRSDLFALGVMFFELLTLRQPFPPVQSTDAGLTAAIEARTAGAPDVREFNPHVPPSIAAVVAKLLEPIPLNRYQSADELRDDLRHHSDDRPLIHAKDRSIRERTIKWHRRNPRLSLIGCVAVLAFGLAFSAAQMMAWARDREAVAAKLKADRFLSEQSGLRLDLASTLDASRREKAIGKAKAWLDDYRVGEAKDWADAPAIRLLPAKEQAQVKAALAETAMLSAHAEWLAGRDGGDGEKAVHFDRAAGYNAAAQAAFGAEAPAAVAAQRKELHGEANDVAPGLSDDPADLYAKAVRLIADGKYKQAIELLVKLTQLEPDHFAAQFALGTCYQAIGKLDRACERFLIAKPLGPNDARPAFHRGLLLYYQGRYKEAEQDFDEAIKREPTFRGVWLHRAFVRKMREDYRGAIEDLSAELNAEDGNHIVALAVRAQIYEKLGNAEAAARDRKDMEQILPVTDLDYVARATRWIETDPKRAVADYERALKLNPVCLSALQNLSHIYGEKLGQPGKALEVIEKAVAAHPGFNQLQAARAVLLARLGRRAEAHKIAEDTLMLGSDPTVTYQAANVYALTSGNHPEDRERCLALFRQCLREGYGKFDVIEADPDMANVRNMPEFKKVLAAAKEMVK